MCLWLTDPDLEKWTIVITNGGDWWHFQGSFSDFLVGVLTRDVICPVISDEFLKSANMEQFTREDLERAAEEDDE